MPTLKPEFGTSGQAVTITLNGLANGVARQSTPWDWSQWQDILISFQFTAAAASVAAFGAVDIFAFATVDNGTVYTGGAGAADADITLLSPTDLIFLVRSFLNAVNQVRREGPISLASVFGGTLPAKGGIVVYNTSGTNLHTAGHAVTWQGVRTQSL